ncbi:HET-domain-containing protein [Hypoxylon sp. FL1857]|nr:HET-domain-containing protein [Hypoxylon sp. FL1857]
MRLINTHTLELKEYFGGQIPRYAILSHTWEGDEATFQGWQNPDRPSVELSEAINSMFSWYNASEVCYAYLADVVPSEDHTSSFRSSRWFTRGWTLQELLAPHAVVFYNREWGEIGMKKDMKAIISEVTRIPAEMMGPISMRLASIAQKMSWAASRTTTRIEDSAYCLLGIFDLNMPLLYGEGSKAFLRLQEELIKISNDQSIFSTWPWTSILAPSPQVFTNSGHIRPGRPQTEKNEKYGDISNRAYSITNAGLSISLQAIQAWNWLINYPIKALSTSSLRKSTVFCSLSMIEVLLTYMA